MSAEPDEARPPLGLLVVDDERQILELLELTLGLRGYTVQLAASGPEALAVFERVPVDVIVMDVLMAPWDGFETVRRLYEHLLQGRAGRALPPVVFLSGLNPPDVLPELADDLIQEYLVKPFRPSDLVAAIERVWAASQVRVSPSGAED